ncbi:hypothetical protein GWK47_018821 [Chionoecetes opilio]|uniref:Uncharacterized protein n=1 Tax=Chionoecetes opilio TaxID=41210 RepID=A0A8J5BXQ9_CHIOP|nr:hypothetical protein GWK47_018821 [Chionoecetes opilio]
MFQVAVRGLWMPVLRLYGLPDGHRQPHHPAHHRPGPLPRHLQTGPTWQADLQTLLPDAGLHLAVVAVLGRVSPARMGQLRVRTFRHHVHHQLAAKRRQLQVVHHDPVRGGVPGAADPHVQLLLPGRPLPAPRQGQRRVHLRLRLGV